MRESIANAAPSSSLQVTSQCSRETNLWEKKIPSRTQHSWEFLCFENNQSAYRCAAADVVACATNNSRVPLSRCTFFPADMITAPSAAFDAFAFKVSPLRP